MSTKEIYIYNSAGLLIKGLITTEALQMLLHEKNHENRYNFLKVKIPIML